MDPFRHCFSGGGFKWFSLRDLLVIPILYLICGFVLFLAQKKLLYHPDFTAFGPCPELPQAKVIEQDGIRALYTPGPNNKIVVIYHGNAGSACDRAGYANNLLSQGYATLLVEYPGYGQVERTPSQREILNMIPNMIAFVQTLSPAKVIVLGESLGSGVAGYHAKLSKPDRLIFITPFSSLRNVVQQKFPIFPASILLRENYNTAEWAKDAPSVRIIYAEDDNVVPNEHALELFDALTTTDKTKVMIKNTGHNTIYGSQDFWRELMDSMP